MYRFKLIHGYHFPWDAPTVAFASGSGAILASLLTIQPMWLILLIGVAFDFCMGAMASRRERTLSFKITEDRGLTNLAILGTSKFFYFLSDNAEHFRSVHPLAGDSAGLVDAYPFGDWVAYTLMLLIIRSIIGHMAVFGIKIPWLTDWLDSLSAKPPVQPPSQENPAAGGSIVR